MKKVGKKIIWKYIISTCIILGILVFFSVGYITGFFKPEIIGKFIGGKFTETAPKVSVDPDNDGLTNEQEATYGTNPNDPDTDNDGLSDGKEIELEISPVNFDTDNDGLGDGDEISRGTDPKDIDSDDDGLEDGYEVQSSKTNPLRVDTDNDGLSDREEVQRYYTNPLKADSDEDGLNDKREIELGTNPKNSDTDNDGLSDGREVQIVSNPLNTDSDNDRLLDGEEVITYGTSPTRADTDNDGLNDYEEVKIYLTNPTKTDTDNDGLGDGDEIRGWDVTIYDSTYHVTSDAKLKDTDNDGLSDYEEYLKKIDPRKIDTDDDGVEDDMDLHPTFDAYLYVEINYWEEKKCPIGGLELCPGDPTFVVSVNGEAKTYNGPGNAKILTNPYTFLFDIPEHKREISISITVRDRDYGDTYETYDINEELQVQYLSLTYDVLSGTKTITSDGSKDGSTVDYDGLIKLNIYVSSHRIRILPS